MISPYYVIQNPVNNSSKLKFQVNFLIVEDPNDTFPGYL